MILVIFLSINLTNIKVVSIVVFAITDFTVIFRLETLVFIINTFLLLKYILYIYYLLKFKKNQLKNKILLDFKSEINIMTLFYIVKLGFKT